MDPWPAVIDEPHSRIPLRAAFTRSADVQVIDADIGRGLCGQMFKRIVLPVVGKPVGPLAGHQGGHQETRRERSGSALSR